MNDYTSNNWSHWNSNEKLREKFGSCTGKTFDRFTTKDSYTWNITHNTESTAVWSFTPERWVSPLVQEKYQEEKACDKRYPYRTIIIIIIIIIKGDCKIVCPIKKMNRRWMNRWWRGRVSVHGFDLGNSKRIYFYIYVVRGRSDVGWIKRA